MIKHDRVLKINNRSIGDDFPTYFIADIAANHDGDINRAKELIYLAAYNGADAAKFQHFSADTIVSNYEFQQSSLASSHQSSWSKSVFEVYHDASLNLDWTKTLKETCDDAGIAFFTSPYSKDLVDFIDPFVPAHKIGSGDITWLDIVSHISSKNKPTFIASGASTFGDVVLAVEEASKVNSKLCLMQCNTNYTANLENFKHIQLNVLKSYRNMFPNLVLGLSDHTPGHATVLGAVALGARVIEKHLTDDNLRNGPDHKFSMNITSWADMIQRTRELENALGDGIKRVEVNEKQTVILQRRSLCVSRKLPAGHVLLENDLIPLRPCGADSISPNEVKKIIGKAIKKNLEKGEALKWDNIKK